MTKGRSILFVLLLTVIVGCATISKWPQQSGFLDSYAGMYRSNVIKGVFVIKHQSKNVNDYSKFLVDPVAVRLTPDAKAYKMAKSKLERIARQFRQNVILALQVNNTVVENPGAGVIRVRLAITDVLANISGSSPKAIVEAEFVDTLSNERIAAVITSNKGMSLDKWVGLLKNKLDYLNRETKIYQDK